MKKWLFWYLKFDYRKLELEFHFQLNFILIFHLIISNDNLLAVKLFLFTFQFFSTQYDLIWFEHYSTLQATNTNFIFFILSHVVVVVNQIIFKFIYLLTHHFLFHSLVHLDHFKTYFHLRKSDIHIQHPSIHPSIDRSMIYNLLIFDV